MKKFFSLLLLGILGFASAQTLTPEVKKSIDAQAFAFTGKHCIRNMTRDVTPTPYPEAFAIQVKEFDAGLRRLMAGNKGVVFRTVSNKDTYRTEISIQGRKMAFLAVFYKSSQAISVSCEL